MPEKPPANKPVEAPAEAGFSDLSFDISRKDDGFAGTLRIPPDAAALLRQAATPRVDVTLLRSSQQPTPEQAVWSLIRDRTSALSFANYEKVMEPIEKQAAGKHVRKLPFAGVDAYEIARAVTEVFLLSETGVIGTADGSMTEVFLEEESRRLGRTISAEALNDSVTQLRTSFGGRLPDHIPFLRDTLERIAAVTDRERVRELRFGQPTAMELIWSYWHEEAMLVQTMNAVMLRFQNHNAGPGLASLELDTLRPLGNLLWGFIQDEQHRLTVARRAHEYVHQYDLRLHGRAVAGMKPADARSRFLEAFHSLLTATCSFYRRDDDTTVIADGFPILNALKDLHFVLTEGAHNQFGDLTWTARAEMLLMQWLLSRPEMKEFLRSRIMVSYREPWMDTVDTMKRLQSWNPVSVTHFSDLARYGEQLLLSARYPRWSDIDDPASAANWARYWRAEVQGYVHAYRAATGMDLGTELVNGAQRGSDGRFVQPSVHMRKRLAGSSPEPAPALPRPS